MSKVLCTKGFIGIDLGTTNCVVSYVNEHGDVDVIPNLDGENITPSFLYFENTPEGKIKTMVGSKAKAMTKVNPDNVVSSFKTKMGTPTVIKNVMNKNITSLECSELLLRYLKASAEKYLGVNVSGAVISVPAYFTEQQKDATKIAARRAGLEVKRIVTEPTAGAFYYGVNSIEKEKAIAVYDLGGGTFDISIISIFEDTSSVLGAPNGDAKLGGDDIDRMLCEYVLKKNGKKKVSKDVQEKIIRICENAKIELCELIARNKYSNPVNIQLEEVGLNTVAISKADFEDMINPLVQRTLVCFEHALKDANMTVEELDEIVLVGGSSRIPYIRECLEKLLNDSRFTVKYFENYAVDPDFAVGLGCGIYLKYVVEEKEKNITDVISKTIGIESELGILEPIIKKGRVMPASKSRTFTNAYDNQTSVICNIYEGEEKIAKHNTFLGRVEIPISGGRKNTIEVLVMARISKDGTLGINIVSSGSSGELKIERQYSEESDWVGNVDIGSSDDFNRDGVHKW